MTRTTSRSLEHRAAARRCSGCAGLPVPLLLHGRRLAAEGAGHLARGRVPDRRLHAGQLHAQINSRVDLVQSLINSAIFTGGVLLGTVFFGVLAGYALARLHFRGRGTLFAVMLLCRSSRSSC